MLRTVSGTTTTLPTSLSETLHDFEKSVAPSQTGSVVLQYSTLPVLRQYCGAFGALRHIWTVTYLKARTHWSNRSRHCCLQDGSLPSKFGCVHSQPYSNDPGIWCGVRLLYAPEVRLQCHTPDVEVVFAHLGDIFPVGPACLQMANENMDSGELGILSGRSCLLGRASGQKPTF